MFDKEPASLPWVQVLILHWQLYRHYSRRNSFNHTFRWGPSGTSKRNKIQELCSSLWYRSTQSRLCKLILNLYSRLWSKQIYFTQKQINKISQLKWMNHYLNGFSAAFPMLSLGLIPIEINSWKRSLHAYGILILYTFFFLQFRHVFVCLKNPHPSHTITV